MMGEGLAKKVDDKKKSPRIMLLSEAFFLKTGGDKKPGTRIMQFRNSKNHGPLLEV